MRLGITTKEGKKRFTTNLDPALVQQLKVEAAKDGKNANDIIEELVKEFLDKRKKK